MARAIFLVVLLVVLLTPLASAAPDKTRVLVELEAGASAQQVAASVAASSSAAASTASTPSGSSSSAASARVLSRSVAAVPVVRHDFGNAFSADLTGEQIAALERDGRVKSVRPAARVRVELSDSVVLINASGVWARGIDGANSTGEGVGVCVIDTGINYSHSDFGGCSPSVFAAGNCSKVPDGIDFVNADSDPYDDEGHGTHVAGIIAANGSIKGVAPGSHILAVKVLDSSGSGSTDDVAAGIEWCVDRQAQYNVSVISLSLGTDTLYGEQCSGLDSVLDSALDAASAANITVVAAAGNDYNRTGAAYPACYGGVVSVGSTTKLDLVSSFSNLAPYLAVLAPGSIINSTSITGGYATKSGTSMATPHVSGALALAFGERLALGEALPNSSSVFAALQTNSFNLTNPGNSSQSFARLNASSFVRLLDVFAPRASFFSPTPPDGTVTNETLFTINASFNEAPSYAAVNVNGSVYPLVRNGSYYSANFSLPHGGHVVQVYYNDSQGNANYTNYSVRIDLEAPKYYGVDGPNATALYDPAGFSFNASFTDDSVFSVFFEFNSSGIAVNYTPSSNGSFYLVSLPALALGNYSYRWYANDSFQSNATPPYEFGVVKGTPNNTISLNGSYGNRQYEYPARINASVANVTPGVLYRDGAALAGLGDEYAPTGLANVTYLFAGEETANFSAFNVTVNASVVDTTPPSLTNLWMTSQFKYVSLQDAAAAHWFNATITDAVGVDYIRLEIDGVAMPVSNSSSLFYALVGNLSAGSHEYSWSYNDSSGNNGSVTAPFYVVLVSDGNTSGAVALLSNGTATILAGLDGLNVTGNASNATFTRIENSSAGASTPFGVPIRGLWLNLSTNSSVELFFNYGSLLPTYLEPSMAIYYRANASEPYVNVSQRSASPYLYANAPLPGEYVLAATLAPTPTPTPTPTPAPTATPAPSSGGGGSGGGSSGGSSSGGSSSPASTSAGIPSSGTSGAPTVSAAPGTPIQGGAFIPTSSDSARNKAALLSLVQTAGVVSVQVFSEDGSPAGGAQVTVQTPDGRTLLLNADSSGFALFGVSEPGSYVFESGSAQSTLSFVRASLQPLAAGEDPSSSSAALSGLAIGLESISQSWRYLGFAFLAIIVLGYAYWRHRESRGRNLFR